MYTHTHTKDRGGYIYTHRQTKKKIAHFKKKKGSLISINKDCSIQKKKCKQTTNKQTQTYIQKTNETTHSQKTKKQPTYMPTTTHPHAHTQKKKQVSCIIHKRCSHNICLQTFQKQTKKPRGLSPCCMYILTPPNKTGKTLAATAFNRWRVMTWIVTFGKKNFHRKVGH